MVQTAWREAGDADETCLLIDAGKGLDAPTRSIIERLKESGREVVAVFNKIGVKVDLFSMVFGESVLNDAVSRESGVVSIK